MRRLPSGIPSVPLVQLGAKPDLGGPQTARPRARLAEGMGEGVALRAMAIA